jgi:hypothetical protein
MPHFGMKISFSLFDHPFTSDGQLKLSYPLPFLQFTPPIPLEKRSEE